MTAQEIGAWYDALSVSHQFAVFMGVILLVGVLFK